MGGVRNASSAGAKGAYIDYKTIIHHVLYQLQLTIAGFRRRKGEKREGKVVKAGGPVERCRAHGSTQTDSNTLSSYVKNLKMKSWGHLRAPTKKREATPCQDGSLAQATHL